MALHQVPAGEAGQHVHAAGCPCGPTSAPATPGMVVGDRPYRGLVFTHQSMPAPAPVELHDRIAIPADEPDEWDRIAASLPAGYQLAPAADPQIGAEAACGHVVVQTDAGEWQHHAIPDDSAPHAPTSECGCQPQRHTVDGHTVFEHVDQDAEGDDRDDDTD